MKWVDGDLVISGKALAVISLILVFVCVVLIILLIADFIRKNQILARGGKESVRRYEAFVANPNLIKTATLTYLDAYNLLSGRKQGFINKFLKYCESHKGVTSRIGKKACIIKKSKISMGKITIKEGIPTSAISVQNIELYKNGIKLKPVKIELISDEEVEIAKETFDESLKSFLEIEEYNKIQKANQ